MRLSKTLIPALRALSTVPDLPTDELKQFTQSVDEDYPMPDASFGADPVWLFPRGLEPSMQFQPLLALLRQRSGLVGHGNYFAFELADVAVVISQGVARTVVEETANEKLSTAESRVAVQLLQGDSLKSAAKADDVGYETKRTHFKVLSAKLGIRGQSEVVRILTAQLLQSLAYFVRPQEHADLDHYAGKFLPLEVRRLNIVAMAGGVVPVLDYGPVTGTPLVVLHPMIFPPIGHEEITQAERLGLRVLWPLRSGLLNRSAPMQSARQHFDGSVSGLFAVLEQLIGRPTPVLALVSSGAVATRAALLKPELIQSISFAATCYSAGRTGLGFRYFGADLAELALRSETMMTRTVAALRRHVDTDKRFRSMLETVFQGSARDLSHLASELGHPVGRERLRAAVLHSSESIKQDYFNQTHFRWDELSKLKVPTKFLQGADDSIHPPSTLAKILKKLNGPTLTVADGMGHLPHREDLRRAIEFAVSSES